LIATKRHKKARKGTKRHEKARKGTKNNRLQAVGEFFDVAVWASAKPQAAPFRIFL
jgi:hypothetical protein